MCVCVCVCVCVYVLIYMVEPYIHIVSSVQVVAIL